MDKPDMVEAITGGVMGALFPLSGPRSRLWAIVRQAVAVVVRRGI